MLVCHNRAIVDMSRCMYTVTPFLSGILFLISFFDSLCLVFMIESLFLISLVVTLLLSISILLELICRVVCPVTC